MDDTCVLPTRVGMVRRLRFSSNTALCSPHPRGDGPPIELNIWRLTSFSPPAWGWSGCGDRVFRLQTVLPTRVGMVRPTFGLSLMLACSPHPRGDGPPTLLNIWRLTSFSPPAWGWSVSFCGVRGCLEVLPTRVGMVRKTCGPTSSSPSSPHPRGDGPKIPPSPASLKRFSPPAWGWSVALLIWFISQIVLPTRVGMVRRSFPPIHGPLCSPHPRGDGPTLA